ncbi:MAG: hypothetical protein ABSD38_28265 [Syntrophorhabdales bacterium]
MKVFIPILAKILCSLRFAKEIKSIVVEGCTDSSGPEPHSWDLSHERSMPFARTGLGVLDADGTKERKAASLSLLSASGRGSAEPLTGPTGSENSALSRRVLFKRGVRSFEKRAFLQVLKQERG